jgi:rod shape-determining protein MreC
MLRKKILLPVVIVSIIALIVLGLKYSGQFWPFRIINDQIANPIGTQLVRAKNAVYEQVSFLGSITNLNKENKNLRQNELELRQQLAALKEVARENELLRNQFQFNARLNLNLVPARVVSVEPDNTRQFITIDRGSSSGVQKGQAVLSSGVLVGTIDEVNDYSSKVFLVNDPDFRLRALGQDGRAQGIVRGQIGQGYVLEKIAQSESISQNEQVVTAGSGLVPQGILIGTVESVNKADNAVFQSANLKPLVDLNSLELVFVVTGLRQ